MLGAIIVEGGLDKTLANIPQRLIVIHGGKPVPPGGKPLPIPGVKPGQIKAAARPRPGGAAGQRHLPADAAHPPGAAAALADRRTPRASAT